MINVQGRATARRYRDRLLRAGIPVQRVLVFGSAARGEATEDSDLDIAVVCTPFAPTRAEEALALWRARWDVDVRIEPLCLHPEDFDRPFFSIVREIQQTGVEV